MRGGWVKVLGWGKEITVAVIPGVKVIKRRTYIGKSYIIERRLKG